MKIKTIVFLLFFSVLVLFAFLFISSSNFINQNYKVELETYYTENIYATYWNFFKKRNNVKGVDNDILLSRYVAYRIYKDRTRSFFMRFFYEWLIRLKLDKKKKMNIMLSTDIYKGGVKGVKNASIKYFGKNVSILSNAELYQLFTKIY